MRTRVHLGYALLSVAMLCASGCGGSERVPLSGRVTRMDGSAVVGARVVFRSPDTGKSASGVTESDGSYQVGTMQKGDGILPGDYQVAVIEDRGSWDNPKPRTVHPKYASPKTSGLSFSVESGQETFNIELERSPQQQGR